MEGKITEGDSPGQGEGTIAPKRMRNVTMGMDVLDCPFCFTPLSPPIFQCSLGHFLCSLCHEELPGTEKACGVCSRPVSDRCHALERVAASVFVPCSHAAHGCDTDAMVYHEMAEHELVCPHAPCFCPEKGCGFAGTTVALVDHLTAQHKWPMTVFKYFEPFEVPVKAGVHVLCCREDKEDDGFFLLHVLYPECPLHPVSLLRVHPHAPKSRFGCSVGFSWFEGHYQVSTVDTIPTMTLSTGLPTNNLFIVTEACLGGTGGRVVLRVTIDRKMVYGDDYNKLFEDDDDDESYIYDEEEDDDGSSEEDDDNDDGSSEEEEEDDDDGEEEGGDEEV